MRDDNINFGKHKNNLKTGPRWARPSKQKQRMFDKIDSSKKFLKNPTRIHSSAQHCIEI